MESASGIVPAHELAFHVWEYTKRCVGSVWQLAITVGELLEDLGAVFHNAVLLLEKWDGEFELPDGLLYVFWAGFPESRPTEKFV